MQLIRFLSCLLFLTTLSCQSHNSKKVMRNTIETTNKIRNLNSLTSEGIREEIYLATKKYIEKIGR